VNVAISLIICDVHVLWPMGELLYDTLQISCMIKANDINMDIVN
jgi:hypothetical protein